MYMYVKFMHSWCEKQFDELYPWNIWIMWFKPLWIDYVCAFLLSSKEFVLLVTISYLWYTWMSSLCVLMQLHWCIFFQSWQLCRLVIVCICRVALLGQVFDFDSKSEYLKNEFRNFIYLFSSRGSYWLCGSSIWWTSS